MAASRSDDPVGSVGPAEVDLEHVERLGAAGELRRHRVSLPLADERAREGRQDRDAPAGGLGLVGADDLIADLLAALSFEEDGGAERYPVPGGGWIDDLGITDLGLQLADSPFHEALLLAGGMILGILAEIAVGAGLGYRLDDGRSLDPLEAVQLLSEALEPGTSHRRPLDGHRPNLPRRRNALPGPDPRPSGSWSAMPAPKVCRPPRGSTRHADDSRQPSDTAQQASHVKPSRAEAETTRHTLRCWIFAPGRGPPPPGPVV